MKKNFSILLCLVLLLLCTRIKSQDSSDGKEGFEGRNLTSKHADADWFKLLSSVQPNLFVIQKAYDTYFRGHPFEKSKETRAFEFWKKHVVGNNYDLYGFVGKQTNNENDLLILKQRTETGAQKAPGQTNAANWTRIPIAPDMLPTWQSSSYTQGTCNMLAIHPTDTTQMIAAFIDGGTLWRTTDNCKTWTQCATNLLVRHFGSVVYSKSNPLIVYAGSAQGVIKSIDGGANWTITGYDQRAGYPGGNEIWTMEVKADDPNTVLFAIGGTLYKTTNGGTTWVTKSLGNGIRDLRALPGDANVVFATVKTSSWAQIQRSSDFGTTWTNITNGYPASVTGYTGELALAAVTPAEPNSVWVELIAKETATSAAKTYGIYKSTDGGLNFTKTPITQDITDNYYQGSWNQAFAISTTNTKIMAGGAAQGYVTKDGGLTWTVAGGGKTGVHSDVHGIVIRGNTVWMVGDGGITKTYNYGKAGTYIHSVDDGIQSHCLWGFDQGWKNDIMVVGMYHGPSTIRDDATYIGWYPGPGADAGDAFVNKGDDRYLYTHPWGLSRITRSTARMTPPTNQTITSIANGNNDMSDPDYYQKLYGYSGSKLMITADNGDSFSDSISFQTSVNDYVVALTDNKIVYSRTGNTILKSTNGGSTWVDVSPKALIGSQNLSHIAVDGLNPQTIWATFSGKQSVIKVAKSIDGGATWVNYSATGILSYAVNNIVCQMGTEGGVYIGTDAGVYYRNNTLNAWVPYNTNLPLATHVGWIKINYAKAKLRIAGQTGIWESDLYSPSTPVAHPTTPYLLSQVGQKVQFNDMSVCLANATFEWTFPSGTPATSNLEKPEVTFSSGGDKNITLKVTDANGTDTRTYNSFVRIRSSVNVATTNWKVIHYDSQYNSGTNAATNVVDGKNTTIWVSKGSGTTKYPHDLWIDMGSKVSIESFKYTPRQDGSTLGGVKSYEWYATNDTLNWGVALAAGTYDATASVKTSTLVSPTTARYIRFRPLSSIDGTGYSSVAEIGIYGSYSVISSFSASNTSIIPGSAITFTDKSAGDPISWQWSFPGGTPSTSTDQNPVVTYSTEGIYPVTLSVSNGIGSDVITKSSYINASAYISRTGWTVKYVDSEEINKEKTPATNIFDGNNSSIWHTQYNPTVIACPHEVQIDMGKIYTIAGFVYVPRQGNTNGRIANYEFYISIDGLTWTLAKKGAWANTATEQSVSFTTSNARYFKIIALSEVNGNGYASIAEIKIKKAENTSTGTLAVKEIDKVSIYSYQDRVFVENENESIAIIQIYDMLGNLVTQKEIGKGVSDIQLRSIGTYVVKVSVNNSRIARKVLIF